ncbi:MAG: hypothetical protein LBP31_01405 [Holosporales bacterium]|jgi:hypothetical protein|nr:hypothetical protein [Holosporales bacterium]
MKKLYIVAASSLSMVCGAVASSEWPIVEANQNPKKVQLVVQAKLNEQNYEIANMKEEMNRKFEETDKKIDNLTALLEESLNKK